MQNSDVAFSEALFAVAAYMRLAAQPELEKRLSKIFSNPKDMRIYELSDGTRSTRDLAEMTNGDRDHISDLWRKWAGLDIAVSSGPQKPYKAKFSLVELALNQENKE